MIIREQDITKPQALTEQEIAHAHELINNWADIKKMMESPGWKLLVEYFSNLMKQYDSIRNCDETNFQYRRGLCDGLNKLLFTPAQLEKLAASAQGKLAEAIKQEESNG